MQENRKFFWGVISGASGGNWVRNTLFQNFLQTCQGFCLNKNGLENSSPFIKIKFKPLLKAVDHTLVDVQRVRNGSR